MGQTPLNVGLCYVYYVNEIKTDWSEKFPKSLVIPVKVLGLPRGAQVEIQLRCFDSVEEIKQSLEIINGKEI